MSRKILIVEDNSLDREMLSTMLSSEYTIIEAKDGKEALDILLHQAKAISAVLLDMIMPTIDGFEVLRRINKNALWNQIPVIVTTALNDETAQETAIELGASGFTVKPYNLSLLLHSLRNCIRMRETAAMVNSIRRDNLTGLYNREAFILEAERMISNAEPGYYLLSCFDIDNFKALNDLYSAETGDAVLVHVAECVRNCLTTISGIAGRFMADRFALLYPEKYKLSDTIKKIHEEIFAPPCLNHLIRLRIGRYLVENPALPVSAMIDRATLAEESIRGRYGAFIAEYDATMRDQLLHEQKIVTKMKTALVGKQFEPWFQPQYNHATGDVIGAEALVRWRDAESGRLVPPCDFIPVFERNGFIYELDKYIWEQVCIFLRSHIDGGYAVVPISVNISRCDVFAPDFFDVITTLLQRYKIPVDLLRLEITESAFAVSDDKIIQTVRRLVDYGFTVEIDDFGSGYSSLNSLKDVPANVLKLDMKFFENTDDSNRAGNIIEAVVRMAKWIGMSVIAEGVETQAQADYLKSIGCLFIQGYYYAKPMMLSDFDQLLKSSHTDLNLHRLETVATFDNRTFWDPKSVETLIFNSYVGGACVIEWVNGKLELIRVNDRVNQECAGKTMHGIPIAELLPDNCLDSENRAILHATINTAIETNKESTCEIKISGVDNDPAGFVYFRWTVRVIAKTENRFMLYGMIFNTSEMRIAEAREMTQAD